jgi:RimJ/RimL family protein N-acetyltransferase
VLLGTEKFDRTLEGERLRLRAPRRSDLAALDAAIQETLPDLILWLPWAHPAHRRADSRRYIRGAQAARASRSAFEFLIERPEDGVLVGMISLHRVDWARRCAGMGYWIRRTCWGKNIATEAARMLFDHAFDSLELQRIEVHVAIGNAASHRVAQKLGLQREGIARGSERIAGEFVDHVQYARLREDRESA